VADEVAPAGPAELVDLAPCGILTTAADGLVVQVNATLLGWTGYDRTQVEGRLRFADLLTPGSRIYHESHYAPLLQLQPEVREIAFTFLRRDGTRFPALVSSRVVEDLGVDGSALVVTSVFEAADRRRYEEELLRERRRAEAAGTRLARLQRFALRLALADGLGETAAVVARSAVGVGGATVTALWLQDAEGWTTSLRARATAADVERPAGSDPPPPRGRPAPGPDRDLPVLDDLVVLTWAEAGAQLPAVTAGLVSPDTDTAADGSRAVVLVPLRDGTRRLGLLACRLDDADEVDPVEADALRTIGHQAGLALARALVSEQQQVVATTLQHSLLPDHLPTSDAFAVACVYEPGQAGAQVGGDWYDAWVLDDRRLAVVVGDVVGRGIQAAATMGRLRSALRAVAPGAGGPAEVLARLDRFVEVVPAGLCATVVLAELDLPTGTLTYACAGHPPPLLLDPAGRVRTLWDGRSLPLGLRPGTGREQAQVQVALGSTLLLYTDGLVERRDVGLPGRLEELARVLAGTGDLGPQQRLDAVRESMLGPVHTGLDDVCVLGLTVGASPEVAAS
jgi:PAS domain S-box-containing protein